MTDLALIKITDAMRRCGEVNQNNKGITLKEQDEFISRHNLKVLGTVPSPGGHNVRVVSEKDIVEITTRKAGPALVSEKAALSLREIEERLVQVLNIIQEETRTSALVVKSVNSMKQSMDEMSKKLDALISLWQK